MDAPLNIKLKLLALTNTLHFLDLFYLGNDITSLKTSPKTP